MAVYAGDKAKFKIGSSEVAQVVSISGPALSVEKIDTTTLASTSKTARPSKKPGNDDLTLELLWDADDSNHMALRSKTDTPATATYAIEFYDADSTTAKEVWTFTGFVTKFEPGGMEVDGNLTASVSIALASKPTVT